MCEIRTKITQKRKNLSVSHEIRTCEGGFAHRACEHNSPVKYALFFLENSDLKEIISQKFKQAHIGASKA